MATAQPSTARQLEAIAGRIHDLAFDFDDGRRSHAATERLIAEVEQAATDLRAAVRGRG